MQLADDSGHYAARIVHESRKPRGAGSPSRTGSRPRSGRRWRRRRSDRRRRRADRVLLRHAPPHLSPAARVLMSTAAAPVATRTKAATDGLAFGRAAQQRETHVRSRQEAGQQPSNRLGPIGQNMSSTMVPGWSCPKCGAVRRSADDTCHGVKPLSHAQADHLIAERKKQSGPSGKRRWD